jgi:hypothetical protein
MLLARFHIFRGLAMKHPTLTCSHSILSMKIIQWQLGLNLQFKGVVPITT